MINFLRHHFIKNYDNVADESVRESHARMSSVVGLILNFFLVLIKLTAGILSMSVALIADGLNNLFDMSSSIISIIGFHISKKPADKNHPFGHERVEYVTGLIISLIIVFAGGSLLYSSLSSIFNYEYKEISNKLLYIMIITLVISILIKLYLYFFYRKMSKIISSKTIMASAYDSLSDMASSSIILIGYIVILFVGDTKFSLDGLLGVLVSLFILYSGIKMIKEMINPIIGEPIKKEDIKDILKDVKESDYIYGVHDVMCHSYGATKKYMTLHAEVDGHKNIMDIHDHIDEVESFIKEKYGVELTIHMDPVILDDERINKAKKILEDDLYKLDSTLDFHDFRIVKKRGIDTILFDLVVPYNYKLSNQELYDYFSSEAKKEGYNILINFDHKFIE